MKFNSSKIAIVVSLFNSKVTLALLDSAVKTLNSSGLSDDDIKVVKVPGAFELPCVSTKLAERSDISCVIAIGCVIRGETPHFEYISQEVTRGLMDVSLVTQKPVIMGVLTTETEAQALERCHLEASEPSLSHEGVKPNAPGDKGVEFAKAALTMIQVFKGDLSF